MEPITPEDLRYSARALLQAADNTDTTIADLGDFEGRLAKHAARLRRVGHWLKAQANEITPDYR